MSSDSPPEGGTKNTAGTMLLRHSLSISNRICRDESFRQTLTVLQIRESMQLSRSFHIGRERLAADKVTPKQGITPHKTGDPSPNSAFRSFGI